VKETKGSSGIPEKKLPLKYEKGDRSSHHEANRRKEFKKTEGRIEAEGGRLEKRKSVVGTPTSRNRVREDPPARESRCERCRKHLQSALGKTRQEELPRPFPPRQDKKKEEVRGGQRDVA